MPRLVAGHRKNFERHSVLLSIMTTFKTSKTGITLLKLANRLVSGTCFIQKIYAPSSSLLKEEEGAYIF